MIEVDEHSRTVKVLLLMAVQIGVIGALAAALPLRGAVGSPDALPWWSIALAFALTESAVLHVQVRREAQTVSISELPLIIGLFFAAPWALVLGRAVGSLAIFAVYRRSPALKTSFNTVLVTMETVIALAVFSLLAGRVDGGDPRDWLTAVLAALTANAAGAIAIGLVIAIYEGSTTVGTLLRGAVTGQLFAPGVVVFALVAVDVLWEGGWSGWLVGLAGLVLTACYRLYATLYDQHVNLQRLYTFSQGVTRTADSDAILEMVLTGARDLLASESAELVLVSPTGPAPAVHAVLAADGEVTRGSASGRAADGWLEREVLHDGRSIVLPRRSRDREVREWLSGRGLRDAVVVPLRGADRILGMLVVGERLGEVRTFDARDVLLLETLASHASVSLEKSELIEQLEHDAMHDALTGLPNRAHLQRRLSEALVQERPGGQKLAVMILDLDGFKDVNDTLGHQQGDLVLIEVAARLAEVVEGDGVVARLGGDEFAILLPSVVGDVAAVAKARQVIDALQVPMSLDSMQFEVSASVGIALSPDHGSEVPVLLKSADLAMYEAKENGLGTSVFELAQDFTHARRLELASALRHALTHGELDVLVQPQVDASSLAAVSVEALARWTHPSLGAISPVEFIPVAERSGLIGPLTMTVLARALAAAAEWREPNVTVAVNLSPRSLLDPALVDDVASALEAAGVPPSRLVLEVTEGAVMTNPDRAIQLLSRLKAMGVRLSVDDFGTGYSSLSYLKRLPIHEVKIDRSFVTHIATSDEDRAIVRSIINLAENLGLEVVAEGVEDTASLDVLRSLGCTRIQGYHVARPMPIESATRWLADHVPTVAAR